MATIDAETLLPSPRMRENALSGEITQLHRGQRYADEGDTFELDGETFEIVDVTERKLGDLTDEDVQKEGARDLEQYREMLEHAHENFEWDDDADVYRHRFERR